MVGVLGVRLFHLYAVLKEVDDSDCLETSVNTFLILATITALLWSCGLFFFTEAGTRQFLSFYTLVSVGITCVAISSQAPVPRIYPAFQFCLLIPLSLFHVYLGGVENYVHGGTAICFMVFGIVLSRRIRRSLIQSIFLELSRTIWTRQTGPPKPCCACSTTCWISPKPTRAASRWKIRPFN